MRIDFIIYYNYLIVTECLNSVVWVLCLIGCFEHYTKIIYEISMFLTGPFYHV